MDNNMLKYSAWLILTAIALCTYATIMIMRGEFLLLFITFWLWWLLGFIPSTYMEINFKRKCNLHTTDLPRTAICSFFGPVFSFAIWSVLYKD